MNDDRFFERLRQDARPLRFDPTDDVVVNRISARIRERLQQPTVAAILAGWLRPLAASLLAIIAAAALSLMTIQDADTTTVADGVEVILAGDTYRVGD